MHGGGGNDGVELGDGMDAEVMKLLKHVAGVDGAHYHETAPKVLLEAATPSAIAWLVVGVTLEFA